jgi:uncharacterized protein
MQKILSNLVCPICKGKLHYQSERQELFCYFDKIAFNVVNDIPVLLVDDARKLTEEEWENRR